MIGRVNTGGGGTKSTIIVSIDTGSTVGIYDSTYTTLIKSASEKSTGKYWLTGLANGTYYIKATKESDEATTSYTITEYGVYRITIAYRPIPEFTYSGTCEVVEDDDTIISDIANYKGNWKIRFLTSGTLSFSNLYGARNGIDVFLVGGGGGGASSGAIKAGAGGGCTTISTATVSVGTDYTIEIGSGGARGSGGIASTAFGLTANGGSTGGNNGGAGGSGGGGRYRVGGSDGADGSGTSEYVGGTGQGSTTREFGGYTNTVLSSVSSSTTFVMGTTPTTVEQAFLVSGKYLTIGNRSGSTGNAGVYPISSFDASTNTVTLSEAITATSGDVVMFGNLYSGGGGGGASSNSQAGGYGGGGKGAAGSTAGGAGATNSGGGGGGSSTSANGGVGGSGIVIIRNKRS